MQSVATRYSLPLFSLFLFAAIIFYAFFGSPTPDDPGSVEAIIGGLLVLSIGAAGLSRSVDLSIGRNPFLTALQVFFLTGLFLPTIAGIYFGNDHMLILRDVLAFAFLGLPLFLSERLAEHEKAIKTLNFLLVLAGIAFSLRTLMPAFNIWIPQGELLYLSNSPLTLFAGVFLAGTLWTALPGIKSGAGFLKVAGATLGIAVLTGAMLLDVQRATVGAIVITVLFLAVMDFIRAPKKVVLPFIIIGASGFLVFPMLGDALQAIAHKTAQVGMNMRVQEAQAVYEALAVKPATFFIGKGWGAVFASPAVGGLDVNYTHSLLTTMALKGGVMLLLPALFVVLTALYQIFLIYQRDRVQGMALFWPLVIPVLLYASHKSLDFGLILLLIGVWSIRAEVLQESHTSCNQKDYSNEQKTGNKQA